MLTEAERERVAEIERRRRRLDPFADLDMMMLYSGKYDPGEHPEAEQVYLAFYNAAETDMDALLALVRRQEEELERARFTMVESQKTGAHPATDNALRVCAAHVDAVLARLREMKSAMPKEGES